MKKNSKQNLVHIKLEQNELKESKRNLLSTEADLIMILQIIKRYEKLRKKELSIKTKLFRKLKETKTKLNKLEKILPKVENLEKEEKENKEKKPLKIEKKKDNLTRQLEEIQKRLKELEK